jgi:hypothetical protein
MDRFDCLYLSVDTIFKSLCLLWSMVFNNISVILVEETQLTCHRSVDVYSIQHYVIQLVSDLPQVCRCVLDTTLCDTVSQ